MGDIRKIVLSGFGGYEEFLEPYLINTELTFPKRYFLSNIKTTLFKTIKEGDDFERVPTIRHAKYGDTILLPLDDGVNVKMYMISEVDISKRWKLEDYDGCLSVKYYSDVEILDEELNYCNWQ